MIWECPHCRDRVVDKPALTRDLRVCIFCTLRLGTFVLRRARKRGGRVAKRNPRLEHAWKGINLEQELKRMLRYCPRGLRDRPPSLVLVQCADTPTTFAFADFETMEITLRLWPFCRASSALASLVHELAHFVVDDGTHDDAWRQAMIELVRDAYRIEPPSPRGSSFQSLDLAVEDAFQEWLGARRDVDELIELEIIGWAQRMRAAKERERPWPPRRLKPPPRRKKGGHAGAGLFGA